MRFSPQLKAHSIKSQHQMQQFADNKCIPVEFEEGEVLVKL